jgi:hypothetical protein
MKGEFDRIREEEAAQAAKEAKEAKDAKDAKTTSPSTAGSPAPVDPAAAPPSSRVGLEVKPANSGMEVSALEETFLIQPPKLGAGSPEAIAVSEPMSGPNAIRFAPYVPDPGSVMP